MRLRARCAQRVRLGLAPTFGHGFGKVREDDREPEPDRELKREAKVAAPRRRITCEDEGREHTAHEHDEHHGIPKHVLRVQLDERVADGATNDRGIEQRPFGGRH
jgi:hypothetical protein